MKLLGEILQLSVAYLKERGIERARRCTEEILSHVLKMERLQVYMNFERPMEESELETCRNLLKRRAKGEPLEYILGEVGFYGCKLEITPAVLIPRPETEILLDKICAQLKNLSLQGKKAWDVCCGPGGLGIGLKKKFPELDVTLSDLSVEALEVARRNAIRNEAEVSFKQGDLLEPFRGEKVDFFLCNPPYISEPEYSALDREVRDFEPKCALIGGPTGLEFYARLARELPQVLNHDAKIFFEIGAGQGVGVGELFNATCWKTKSLEKDWAGHDRFFFLEFQ